MKTLFQSTYNKLFSHTIGLNMLMHVINYLVRILIMVIGIVFATGIFTPKSQDSSMMRVMGVVLILWGFYRLLTYRARVRQLERERNEN